MVHCNAMVMESVIIVVCILVCLKQCAFRARQLDTTAKGGHQGGVDNLSIIQYSLRRRRERSHIVNVQYGGHSSSLDFFE
jgi:hypothetical protein